MSSSFLLPGRSTVAEKAKARLLSRSVVVKPRSPTAVKNLHVRRSITRGLTPLEERVSNADAYYDPNYLGLQDPSTERWGGVDDDDDLAAWDEETTLVELLRDKYVMTAYMRPFRTAIALQTLTYVVTVR